jgi:hypothetical protein
VRLPRDYYLRVLGNDYSIDPAVIGRVIDIYAGLETVTARCESVLVADHPRSWARRQTITDPAHDAATARLRAAPPTGAARLSNTCDTAHGLGPSGRLRRPLRRRLRHHQQRRA